MTLDDIKAGQRVLVDANILLYFSAGASPQCRRLLRRGERRELSLSISAATAAEARHGFMLAEARSRGLLTGSNPARRLKESPELVRSLTTYLDLEKDLRAALELLGLTQEILEQGARVSAETGLLTNDALLVATARAHEIVCVASADQDLKRVEGLRVYAPSDL